MTRARYVVCSYTEWIDSVVGKSIRIKVHLNSVEIDPLPYRVDTRSSKFSISEETEV